jgi:hypothetical protein
MDWITEDEIRYFRQLDERQQRLFAGLKAKTLGRSGVRLVSERLSLHENTVRKGKAELAELPTTADRRIRKKGGGAKKK